MFVNVVQVMGTNFIPIKEVCIVYIVSASINVKTTINFLTTQRFCVKCNWKLNVRNDNFSR